MPNSEWKRIRIFCGKTTILPSIQTKNPASEEERLNASNTNKPPHKEMCRGFSMLMSCCGLVYLASQFLDIVAVDVVVVLHELVDVPLGAKLDDAVGYGLDELVVV